MYNRLNILFICVHIFISANYITQIGTDSNRVNLNWSNRILFHNHISISQAKQYVLLLCVATQHSLTHSYHVPDTFHAIRKCNKKTSPVNINDRSHLSVCVFFFKFFFLFNNFYFILQFLKTINFKNFRAMKKKINFIWWLLHISDLGYHQHNGYKENSFSFNTLSHHYGIERFIPCNLYIVISILIFFFFFVDELLW